MRNYPVPVTTSIRHHYDVFPRYLMIEIGDKSFQDWLLAALTEREKSLNRELLKCQIILDALETKDFSLVSDSMMEEFKTEVEELRSEKRLKEGATV